MNNPVGQLGAMSRDVRNEEGFPLVGAGPGGPGPGERRGNKKLKDKLGQ